MHESLSSTNNNWKTRSRLIHVGTNDIPTRRQPDVMAEVVIQLAMKLKTHSCDVSSNIVARNNELRKNALVVSHKLNGLCKEKGLYYIDHSNSVNTRHLNDSKLYLNITSTKIFFNNFVEAISNVLLWQSISHSVSDSNCVHIIHEYNFEPKNVKGIESLKTIRKLNLNNIVVAHLNVSLICLIE